MNATWMVMAREFSERLRSRAFLISNGAILALIALSMGLPMLLGGDGVTQLGTLGDDAAMVGRIASSQQEAFDVELELVALGDRTEAEAALEDGEVEAVLLDATTVLAEGGIGPQLEALLANASNAVGVDAALAEAGLDAEERAGLFALDPLTVERLDAE